MTEDKPREIDILQKFNNRQALEIRDLQKEIVDLKAELHEQFEQGISIIHDQGAENLMLKAELAQIKSVVKVFNAIPGEIL